MSKIFDTSKLFSKSDSLKDTFFNKTKTPQNLQANSYSEKKLAKIQEGRDSIHKNRPKANKLGLNGPNLELVMRLLDQLEQLLNWQGDMKQVGIYFDLCKQIEQDTKSIKKKTKIPDGYKDYLVSLSQFCLHWKPHAFGFEPDQRTPEEIEKDDLEYQKYAEELDARINQVKDNVKEFLEKKGKSAILARADRYFDRVKGLSSRDEQGGRLAVDTESIKQEIIKDLEFDHWGYSSISYQLADEVAKAPYMAKAHLTPEDLDDITETLYQKYPQIGSKKYYLKSKKNQRELIKDFKKRATDLIIQHLQDHLLVSDTYLPYAAIKDAEKRNTATLSILLVEVDDLLQSDRLHDLLLQYVYDHVEEVFATVDKQRKSRDKASQRTSKATIAEDIQNEVIGTIRKAPTEQQIPDEVQALSAEICNRLTSGEEQASELDKFICKCWNNHKPFYLEERAKKYDVELASEVLDYYNDIAHHQGWRLPSDIPTNTSYEIAQTLEPTTQQDSTSTPTSEVTQEDPTTHIDVDQDLSYENMVEILNQLGYRITCSSSSLRKGYQRALENKLNHKGFLRNLKFQRRKQAGNSAWLRIDRNFRLVRKYHHITGIYSHKEHERQYSMIFSEAKKKH